VSRDKASTIFSCGLNFLRILFLFEWILRDDAVELFWWERIAIVSEDESSVFYDDFQDDFIKLVANIFCILHQLPDPSLLSILIFVEVLDILRKFLRFQTKSSELVPFVEFLQSWTHVFAVEKNYNLVNSKGI